MEQKKNFKPIVQDSDTLSSKGNVGRHHPSPPIGKSLDEIGLQNANVNGEAIVKRPVITKAKNKKGSRYAPLTLEDYEHHTKIEISPNVFIILAPNSTTKIASFADFIHVSESTVNIVDVIPRLYESHYDIIKHSSTRFMVGDSVIVGFKYRNINPAKAIKQVEPKIIKDIKFVSLVDRTAIIAYLDDDDFYPINELDHYDTN